MKIFKKFFYKEGTLNLSKLLYYFLILLSFSILLGRWKKLDKNVHLFLGIYVFTILTELIFDWFKVLYIYHIYGLIELSIFALYYFRLFEIKRNKWIAVSFCLIYFVFFLYSFVFQKHVFFTLNRTDMLLEGIFVTILSILFLIEIYQNEKPVILLTYPHFWLVIANMLFFSVTSIFNGFTQYLFEKNVAEYANLTIILKISNYLLFLLYLTAFLCNIRVKKLD